MGRMEEVKARYENIQTDLKAVHDSGCLFLSLLSIAEEETGVCVDLIDAYHAALERKWIAPDMTCLDQCEMLKHLTNRKWMRKIIDPGNLSSVNFENAYTVAKYKNPKTGITHFRRRYFDTIKGAKTVRDGYLVEYYVYEVKN